MFSHCAVMLGIFVNSVTKDKSIPTSFTMVSVISAIIRNSFTTRYKSFPTLVSGIQPIIRDTTRKCGEI